MSDEIQRIAVESRQGGSPAFLLIVSCVMVLLTGGVVWNLLVPNMPPLLTGPQTVAVVGDVEGVLVEAALRIDGHTVTGRVVGDPDAATTEAYVQRWPERQLLASSEVRVGTTTGVALTIAGLAGVLIPLRTIRRHRRADASVEQDLDPATRQRIPMLARTTWQTSMYASYSVLTLHDPDTQQRRFKTRFGHRMPDTDLFPVTVHGRLEPDGNAVIEFADGDLLPIDEPLIPRRRWRPGR